MLIKLQPIFIIIFLFAITKSKSEIQNCRFVNTVNLTNATATTYIKNNTEIKIDPTLVADYDFIVLINDTKVNVPMHKRGCICADPCLTMCSEESVDLYYEFFDIMELSFLRNVTLKNSTTIALDLVKHFNFRLPGEKCENMYPLVMEERENDHWSIFENGTLLIRYGQEYRNHEKYCFDLYEFDENSSYEGSIISPYICPKVNDDYKQNHLRNWAMVCSIPFFLMTIFCYCFLVEFRNCHSKCFIMYLINITVTYCLTSYASLATRQFEELECLTIAYLIYFATIAFLTWICVISYDTFICLTGFNRTILFRNYFKWGLVIPAAATFTIYVIQTHIDTKYKPGIESGNCGVNTKVWSATLYYYIPHMIVLIFCLTMFIKLIRFLVVNERDATKLAGRIKTSYMKRFSLYFRLFIFMGVVWFLEILSYFLDMTSQGGANLTLTLDLLNALHGIFVFFTIMCSSNIHRHIKKRFFSRGYAEHVLITRTFDISSE